MSTEYKRVKHAQRNTEANALANIKTRENRLTTDTKRWVSKLEDGTEVLEGGDAVRYLERFGTLAAALTAFGSTRIHAVLTDTLTLTGNATIPENVFLDAREGGVINLNGFTLTINGGLACGLRKVFNGSGTVAFGRAQWTYPEWWGALGDGSTVDTTACQAALTQGKNVVFSYGRTYITRQLSVPSNCNIQIMPGAVVKGNSSYSDVEDIFRLRSVSNVEINGHGGGVIQGIRFGTNVPPNDQHGRMAIRMDEATNIYIHDLITKDTDGDGIYLGTSVNATSAKNRNIKVERVTCDNHQRQGASIISGEDVWFKSCWFKNIGTSTGSDPSAGLDIEPDSDYAQLKNINIEDCVSDTCNGAGFLVHLPTVNGTQEADKKIDIHFRRCRAISCNGEGFRVTSVITEKAIFEFEDIEAVSCGLAGILIGNKAIQSLCRFRGKTRLINNFTRSLSSSLPFPYWNSTGGVANSDTKVDFLVYTNTVAAWETLNGSNGLIAGGIIVEELQVLQESTDIDFFRSDNYNQADGAASGTVRFPIRQVLFQRCYIRNPGGKKWSVDAAYGQDVRFAEAFLWDGTNYRWKNINESHTSDDTMADNTDQDIVHDNAGTAALVTFTLPAAQATFDRKQRYRFRVDSALGIAIVAGSGDLILMPSMGGLGGAIVSYALGAEIELEKYDATYWVATVFRGGWFVSNVTDISDADYTVSRADHNKILTDVSTTAARTFNLPSGAANLVGLRVTFHNRVSGFRCIIDPASGDSILGLETTFAGRIQAGAQGSTITLVYTGSNTWMVESWSGSWYDLDASTHNNGQRYIGNHIFTGRMYPKGGASITAANDITLGSDGMSFPISGNTTINRIATSGWWEGAEVTLRFTGTPTVADAVATGGGFAAINLNGSANQAMTAGSLLKLRFNGTDWDEIGRMIN